MFDAGERLSLAKFLESAERSSAFASLSVAIGLCSSVVKTASLLI